MELSQSRIAGRRKPSSACTIIAIKLAETIYRQGIRLISNFEGFTLTLSDEMNSVNPPSVPVSQASKFFLERRILPADDDR